MYQEVNRLNSFKDNGWPSHHVLISEVRLANAGFYYQGDEDRVRCFSCDGELRCWRESDSPKRRHKYAFPDCKFVGGKDTRNISLDGVLRTELGSRPYRPTPPLHKVTLPDPLSSTTAESFGKHEKPSFENRIITRGSDFSDEYPIGLRTNHLALSSIPKTTDMGRILDQPPLTISHSHGSYASEFNRLQSFWDWPLTSPVDRYEMAAAGFYRKKGNVLKCFACYVEVDYAWRAGDRPLAKHHQSSPSCPFVRGLSTNNEVMTSRQRRLAVISSQSRFPQYGDMRARLATFVNWPKRCPQRPIDLAEDGFFSNDQGDMVTCFCCGCHLLDWEADDVPLLEHETWNRQCNWLKEQLAISRPPPPRNDDVSVY